MKKVGLFLFLVFAITKSYAQIDSSKSVRTGQIAYTRSGFFSAGKFTVNGQTETFSEINTRLANSKASADEYNQFRQNANLTTYSFVGSLAFLASSLIVNGSTSRWKNTPAKVLFGTGIAFIIPEIVFAGKRNKHFSQAIRLYNQQ